MAVDRRPPRRFRRFLVFFLSLFLHLTALGWLARPPHLTRPAVQSNPVVISLEIIPPLEHERTPKASSRPLRFPPDVSPRAKLAPGKSAGVAGPPQAPERSLQQDRDTIAPFGTRPSEALRATLRASGGCSYAALHKLSLQERQRCDEVFGRRTTSAPEYAAPMDPAKRADFDQVVAAYQGRTPEASTEAAPGAVSPDAAYVQLFKCSVPLGVGRKPKGSRGTLRLGPSPCGVRLQASWFTPEASLPKR